MRTNGVTAARNIAQVLSGPYRVPNIRLRRRAAADQQDAVRHLSRAGPLRGGFLPRAAVRHGGERSRHRPRRIPPPQSRRRSTRCPGRCRPCSRSTRAARPTPATTGRRSIAASQDFGWADKSKLQGKLIDGRYHGIAVGCYLEGGGSGPRENVRMVLETRRHGLALCRLVVGRAGRRDGVRADRRRRARHADGRASTACSTARPRYVKQGYGSYSLALDRDGRLGHRAGGGQAEGRDPRRGGEAPAMRAGRRSSSTATMRSDRTAHRSRSSALAPDGISAEGTYASNKRTYSYGAHAAHVAVDPGTGHVALIDYMAVEDVGRIINPLTLHGQTVGAIVQGLGGALLEHLVYDEDGQFLSGSLADYLLPTASDFPGDPRARAGGEARAAQSARRQGRGRGRHHPGRRRDRQRGRQRARRRAECAAAVAAAGVGVDSGQAQSGVPSVITSSAVIARAGGRSSNRHGYWMPRLRGA